MFAFARTSTASFSIQPATWKRKFYANVAFYFPDMPKGTFALLYATTPQHFQVAESPYCVTSQRRTPGNAKEQEHRLPARE